MLLVLIGKGEWNSKVAVLVCMYVCMYADGLSRVEEREWGCGGEKVCGHYLGDMEILIRIDGAVSRSASLSTLDMLR